MDTAKTFKPDTILLWQKIADHPEAQRIVNLFPSADLKIIEHQRIPPSPNLPTNQVFHKGKKTLMIGQTSSFVGHFDGQLGATVRCCPYHKLVPVSNGCPYHCTYCYLAFVYRRYQPFIKLNINYETMFKQLRKVSDNTNGHANFNMGEMLDSLSLDHITNLTIKLVPFVRQIPNAYLMMLTKSSNIDNLLTVEPNNHTVLSWSLNSQYIIDEYESGTASLAERIEAARTCQKYGYRIRYRIDPGLLCPDWQNQYTDLIRKALTVTTPENITLGMLRLLPGHFRFAVEVYGDNAKKLFSHIFTSGASDGKLRYEPAKRLEFYNFLIDTIRSFNKNVSISLCRETPHIWQSLKNRCEPHKCNCITW
jgi:spore photoproduct lyase